MNKYNYVVFVDQGLRRPMYFCETIGEAMKLYDLVTLAYNKECNDTNLTTAEMGIFTIEQFEKQIVDSYEWAVQCFTFDEFVDFQNDIFKEYLEGQNSTPYFYLILPIDKICGLWYNRTDTLV